MPELRTLLKQQGSLIRYIRKQRGVFDYMAHNPMEECGYCVPRGVFVACGPVLLRRLQRHARRYYPDMTVGSYDDSPIMRIYREQRDAVLSTLRGGEHL